MRLGTHLWFDGQCAEAFRHYERLLDGKLVTLLTYGESPLGQQTPRQFRDRIIHATLSVGSFELLGADVLPEQWERPQGFSVILNLSDLARASAIFTSLSEGGHVRMPFAATFWSPGFGMVVDRFGTPWEINCEAAVD